LKKLCTSYNEKLKILIIVRSFYIGYIAFKMSSKKLEISKRLEISKKLEISKELLVTKQGNKQDDKPRKKKFSKVCDRYRTRKSRSRSRPRVNTSLQRSSDSNRNRNVELSPKPIPLTEPPKRISRKSERRPEHNIEKEGLVTKNLLQSFNDTVSVTIVKTGYDLFSETDSDLDDFVPEHKNCKCCNGFIFCCKYYTNKVCFCHHIDFGEKN